jgi:hypothetical protein
MCILAISLIMAVIMPEKPEGGLDSLQNIS